MSCLRSLWRRLFRRQDKSKSEVSTLKELAIKQNDELNQIKDQLSNIMEVNVRLASDLQAVNESVMACQAEIKVLNTENATVTKTKVEELEQKYQQDLSYEREKWTQVANELKYLKVELFLNLEWELQSFKNQIQNQLDNEQKETKCSEQNVIENLNDTNCPENQLVNQQKETKCNEQNLIGNLNDTNCPESKKSKRRQRRKRR